MFYPLEWCQESPVIAQDLNKIQSCNVQVSIKNITHNTKNQDANCMIKKKFQHQDGTEVRIIKQGFQNSHHKNS